MVTLELTIVTVTLEDRDDGGLRIFSDDLPGLIMSVKNRDGIEAKIVKAIEILFDYKGYKGVRVRSTIPIQSVMQQEGPHDVDMHVQHERRQEQFVVELPAAA